MRISDWSSDLCSSDLFGSQVTIVNRSGTLLRGYDEQIRDRLLQISTMKGINFRLNAEMEKIEKKEDGTLTVRFKSGDPIACDLLLFATGRRPHVEGLGLENAGVELSDKGAIKVDDYSRTSCESIYAVGDVTDRIDRTSTR